MPFAVDLFVLGAKNNSAAFTSFEDRYEILPCHLNYVIALRRQGSSPEMDVPFCATQIGEPLCQPGVFHFYLATFLTALKMATPKILDDLLEILYFQTELGKFIACSKI